MGQVKPNRNLGLLLIVAGVALILTAVLLFTIDSDPAWVFGDPVLSVVGAMAGLGLIFAGWQRTKSPASEE